MLVQGDLESLQFPVGTIPWYEQLSAGVTQWRNYTNAHTTGICYYQYSNNDMPLFVVNSLRNSQIINEPCPEHNTIKTIQREHLLREITSTISAHYG